MYDYYIHAVYMIDQIYCDELLSQKLKTVKKSTQPNQSGEDDGTMTYCHPKILNNIRILIYSPLNRVSENSDANGSYFNCRE